MMPRWPGDPAVVLQTHAAVARDGYFLQGLTLGEHTGTHVGAPAHFLPGGLSIDRIPPERLLCPAVVLDISARATQDADSILTRADVHAWEASHGLIPAGCLALLHTGWARRWHDPEAFLNADAQGTLHFPGFGLEAVRCLLVERGVAGLGTDTHGIDPGTDGSFAVNRLLAAQGGLHLECLARLDELPATGSLLFLGVLPIQGGSGSPARVLALVP
jgi:kynurenine formamidase